MCAERSEPHDREIVTTRHFAVTRERLFEAWISPARLARWWGPSDFTNTFETFDPRPGGEWRFVMHGPDGTDYENRSIFVEIVHPERIVFDHVSDHRFRVVATFDVEGNGTRLTFRMTFETADEAARVASTVTETNEQNFDRLEQELGLTD